MRAALFGFMIGLAVSAASSSRAASLQVAPVSIEAIAPAAAATISLRNKSTAPLNAQIRVFRWVQEGGKEKLIPTDAVVASPPMATLASGAEYTVRIVRLSKEPVQGEESYRLLVDELPAPATEQNKSVKLIIRYSIPVFFFSNNSAAAKVTWSIEEYAGRSYLVATNVGERHIRISQLSVRRTSGISTSFGPGLVGYVLGRSSMRWQPPDRAAHLTTGQSAIITAQTDLGPIHALPAQRPSH